MPTAHHPTKLLLTFGSQRIVTASMPATDVLSYVMQIADAAAGSGETEPKHVLPASAADAHPTRRSARKLIVESGGSGKGAVDHQHNELAHTNDTRVADMLLVRLRGARLVRHLPRRAASSLPPPPVLPPPGRALLAADSLEDLAAVLESWHAWRPGPTSWTPEHVADALERYAELGAARRAGSACQPSATAAASRVRAAVLPALGRAYFRTDALGLERMMRCDRG